VNINIRMLHRDSDASKKCDHLLGGNEENVAGRGLRAPGNWPGGGSQGQPLVTLLISEVQLILREFAMVLPPPPLRYKQPPHPPPLTLTWARCLGYSMFLSC
jgi:hypothetical protein